MMHLLTPRLAKLRRSWTTLEIDRRTALPLITLLVLLTSAPEVWYLRTPLLLLSVLALVYRQLRTSAAFWFVCSTLLGATIYLHWESSDNHKYVITYWCLALCASFTVARSRQEETLALSSRWLIGLCMLLATLWKLATPEYLDGTFFEYTLLADERFARFTETVAGTSSSLLADNRTLRDLLVHGYERGLEISSISLSSSERIRVVAWLLTWWTVLIEGLLGILFLWPDRPSLARWRNGLLILFAVSTYSVAPVRGFGWMLMLLGMAQCDDRDRRWRFLYLCVFLLIQLYTLPSASLLEVFWQ